MVFAHGTALPEAPQGQGREHLLAPETAAGKERGAEARLDTARDQPDCVNLVRHGQRQRARPEIAFGREAQTVGEAWQDIAPLRRL